MTDQPARGGHKDAMGADMPIGLSRAVLIWEALEIAFWRPVSFLILFLAVAVTGILPDLAAWAHAAVLLASALIFCGLMIQGFRRFHLPQYEAARRRVEIVNKLDHRPLESLADRPSGDSPVQLALWHAHQARLRERLGHLSVGVPTPQLAKRDPLALRLIAPFLLIISLFAAGGDSFERLRIALVPNIGTSAPTLAVGIDAWLAPPDYTGLPPIYMSSSKEQVPNAADQTDTAIKGNDYSTPIGSRLVVQVSGVPDGATLITPQGPMPMARFADNAVALEHEIQKSGTFSIESDGDTVASWEIRAMPDEPPVVTLPDPPVASVQRALTITHTVSDDFGVTALRAEIERADRPAGSAQSSARGDEEMMIVTQLPVPDPSKYGTKRRAYRDYTAHPWAGGEVRLTLIATDALGQEGRSEPVTLILPAREFSHPVAKVIVELRRELAWDPMRNYRGVSDALDALSWDHHAFDDKVTVFMALRQAARALSPNRRSGEAPNTKTINSVVDLLWKTALYLEDGGVSLALQRLRDAQQALMDALSNGADAAELDKLMDDLQKAMQDYMQAMAEQMRQNMAEGQNPPEMAPGENVVSQRDIEDMMQQLRDMMQNGMTDSAQQMLEQLRNMMENMQAGMQQQMSPQNQQAMEMLNSMKDIMESQRELMDRTHRRDLERRGDSKPEQGQAGQQSQAQRNQQSQGQAQQGQQGESGDQQRAQDKADAVLQDALRRQLGEVMRKFGEMMGQIPEPFGRADEGMGEATQRLGDGKPGEAVDSQGKALDAMQEAADAARSAFIERFEQQMGLGQQMPGQSGEQTMDPFGREASDTFRGSMQGQVKVPDKGGLEKAREIRDELRRRAGDRSRPTEDLDYIDRLLDQF
ncbi:MAG: TIGR02302 family protein [Alphaproteobacteria bacterium]|nr:TIGR02302 family protein [Alphaproteobacteria bacterium]